MPRKAPIKEDQSFSGDPPSRYRRYKKQTKTKLCFLVKRLGWTTSSAAKLLKVKSSTAKMVVSEFVHEDFSELETRLRNKYAKGKKGISKKQKKILEMAKKEEDEAKVLFLVYFHLDPSIMAKYEEKVKKEEEEEEKK